MNWLVFSYSLPSKSRSSPRVTLWRRLRRFGAISIKTGVYILPARDECIEAFQWLAQEVQQAKGEALVFYVEQFEGLTDEQLIEMFREIRQQDYLEIEQQATVIEAKISTQQKIKVAEVQDADTQVQFVLLAKLKKRYSEILRLDFFNCPDAQIVAARLTRIEQAFHQPNPSDLSSVTIAEYRDRRWVTRPRPFIDRLACAWLIRKFINPNAIIRYSLQPESDEVAFDMKEAEFGHQSNLCSFETMMFKFGLEKSGITAIAKIVHELDLRDGQYISPETAGVETILRGWLLARLSDSELESRGIQLFEGLYLALAKIKES
jgi:hypothetical protein